MSWRWLKMPIFQKQVESLLEDKIGLSVKSVGHERIRHVVSQRMASCGMTDQSAYLEYLSGSEQEWEELVESVVIPETWFFRNQNSFLFLAHYVMTEWSPRNPDQVLRILSIPCATGEEAYSVAMTLTDAGFPLERLHLDGADISARSLRKAAQGIYSRESFREKENIRQISDALRQKIRWIRGNLLDPEFLMNEMPYNMIFCRNLMIYLSDSARRQVMSAISRLLSPEGLLFVGHAELPLFSLPGMTRITQPGVFAFRKKSGVAEKNKPSEKAEKRIRPSLPAVVSSAPLPEITVKLPSPAIKQKPAEVGEENLLEQAEKFADQGYLDKAEELYKKHLSIHPTDAQAHFMMGLMMLAMKDEIAAENWFNKAIYLDPKHREALHHLALIREKQGDSVGANHLRQRAVRSGK